MAAASDEPRRSGRATKGQHKNAEDSAEPSPKPTSAPATTKKGNKSKGSKKAAEAASSVDENNDDENGDGEIRCVCGDSSEHATGVLSSFVACDACEAWQHNVCMDVPLSEDQQPDHYFCEQCRPEEHQELLESMAREEKIWEDRIKAAKNRRKSGGKKTKGKASRQSRVSDVKQENATSSSPAPPTSQESGNKRKFEEEAIETSPPPNEPAQPQEPRRSSAARDKRRKSNAADAKLGSSEDAQTALVDIDKLPKERQNVGIAISKLASEQIRERSKAGQFRIPDGHTADSLGKHHASRIEYALYMNHVGLGQAPNTAYAQQFRQILANLKKNALLFDRLLNGSLTADELSIMSSQDMASEELQKERAQLKEETDKQSIMLRDDDKPRVRRTHKGDEYVDDSEQNAESGTVFAAQPVRHRESIADAEVGTVTSPPHAHSPQNMDTEQPSSVDASRPTPSHDRRTSSQQFDISNVWAKTQQSPGDVDHSQPRRRASSFVQQESKQTDDAEIDRLLADDNDEEYSPADLGSNVVWRGQLHQPGVAELKASGRFIAGNDFSRFIPWSQFLPNAIDIEGRLERAKADTYLCGLQWSKRSDVSVIALTPYDNREAFDAIFDYFHSRDRYAVGKRGHGISELVKDLYLTPVEAGSKPPPHIELLDHCSVDFPLTERMLFATFVVNKPASWDSASDAPSLPDAGQVPDNSGLPPHLRTSISSISSPLSSHPPQYSPRPSAGFTPVDTSNGYAGGGQAFGQKSGLPPNPYSTPVSQPYMSPQPIQQQGPSAPGSLAQSILGPYAGAPVVARLLEAAGGNPPEHILKNMRDVLEKDPRAREDMNVFSAALAQGYQGAPS